MPKHRNDIDGLRALAVGLVLLFHADLAFVGGFVGVDVFFVISGYLISHIVIRDITAGEFRFTDFWVRRIRRLFPAMAVMVAVSFAVGLVLFVPEHLAEMSESVIAQPLLYANGLFWNNTGYFAVGAELLPLLHTWSLAVEEQFYLVFPPVMICLLWRGLRNAAWGVLCFLLISAAWSVYASTYFPAAAFFLLPSRIWEFDIGVLLAILHRSRHATDAPNGVTSEVLSWSGLALILLPAMCYDDTVAFPGIAALPPCLGAAMLIHANRRRLTVSGRILASRPFAFTGRISYSLYLWHWPLFVFARYVLIDRFTLPLRVLVLAACWPIAFLSWKFVETPVRTARLFPRRAQLLTATGLLSIVLIGSGVVVMQSEGLPQRFPVEIYAHQSEPYQIPDFVRYDDIADPSLVPLIGDRRSAGQPTVLLWGDSHAMSVMPPFDVIGKELERGVFVAAQPGIPPLAGAWPLRKCLQPVDYGRTILEFVQVKGIRHVVLAARWNMYVYGGAKGDRSHLICDCSTTSCSCAEAESVFLKALRETCQRLRAAGAQTWILRQVPFQPHHTPGTILKLAIRQRDLNDLAVTVNEHRSRFAAINKLLDSVADTSVRYLDPVPLVTDRAGRCRTAIDGVAAYKDQDHLSAHGAFQLSALVRRVLEEPVGHRRTAQSEPTGSRH
ncbi:MAG: acyltransferase family protein [Planctomycetaceae bacterium]